MGKQKGTSKNGIGNFQTFRVFDFGPYIEIGNSKNSEIFLRFVNFKECVLLEEAGNFRDLQVFDFSPYIETEDSQNSEILC